MYPLLSVVGTLVLILNFASSEECSFIDVCRDVKYVLPKVNYLTTDSLQYGQRLSSENKERLASEKKTEQVLAKITEDNKEQGAKIGELIKYRADHLRDYTAIRKELKNMKKEQKKLHNKDISLTKQLQSERRKITELKIEMNRQISEVKNLIASYQRVVAFSAYVTKAQEITGLQTIVFGGVRSNIGGAYSPSSGIFTAPLNGSYMFFAKILSRKLYGEYGLVVDGAVKMRLLTHPSGSNWINSSNAVIVRMKKGSNARLKTTFPIRNGTKFYVHHAWSTFSGYLLQADI